MKFHLVTKHDDNSLGEALIYSCKYCDYKTCKPRHLTIHVKYHEINKGNCSVNSHQFSNFFFLLYNLYGVSVFMHVVILSSDSKVIIEREVSTPKQGDNVFGSIHPSVTALTAEPVDLYIQYVYRS